MDSSFVCPNALQCVQAIEHQRVLSEMNYQNHILTINTALFTTEILSRNSSVVTFKFENTSAQERVIERAKAL